MIVVDNLFLPVGVTALILSLRFTIGTGAFLHQRTNETLSKMKDEKSTTVYRILMQTK